MFKHDLTLLRFAWTRVRQWHERQATLGMMFDEGTRQECLTVADRLMPELGKAIHHAFHGKPFEVEFKRTKRILGQCPHAAEVCAGYLTKVESRRCAAILPTATKTSRRSSSSR
jgi:hypothetical protein